MALAGAGSDGDRLQHLLSVLPTEVRVTAETHPLFGRVLKAVGFKRVGGTLFLVAVLPDGSPGTVRADATHMCGESESGGVVTVLTVEGIRGVMALAERLRGEKPARVGRRK